MANKARSGRPRLSTPRADKKLRRICLQNRFMTSRQLSTEWCLGTGTQASSSLVRRRLIGMGLKARKAKQKPILSAAMRKKRLQWAKTHVKWSDKDWKKVIFSDESRFCTVSDAPQLVRRTSREAMKPECLQRTTKHPPPAVMIWGCMTSTNVGRMYFVEKTMNSEQYRKVLTDKLLPSAHDQFGSTEWIFQQDLAPCHTSKMVSNCLVFTLIFLTFH